jgi:hypothetical protein
MKGKVARSEGDMAGQTLPARGQACRQADRI